MLAAATSSPVAMVAFRQQAALGGRRLVCLSSLIMVITSVVNPNWLRCGSRIPDPDFYLNTREPN